MWKSEAIKKRVSKVFLEILFSFRSKIFSNPQSFRENRSKSFNRLFVFTWLVCDTAWSFASRLAWCLAFTASALCRTFFRIARCNCLNSFHFHPSLCKKSIYYSQIIWNFRSKSKGEAAIINKCRAIILSHSWLCATKRTWRIANYIMIFSQKLCYNDRRHQLVIAVIIIECRAMILSHA